MHFTEKMSITGRLKILINNTVVKEIDNLVVTAGKDWIASRMQGVADAVMSHIAIGTGTTAAAVGDTALETEIARTALTTSGGTVAANVITFDTTIGAGVGTGAITEAGVLNAGGGGTLLARTTFTVVNKAALDTMTISWDITIS